MRSEDEGWVPDDSRYDSVKDVEGVLEGGFETEPDVVQAFRVVDFFNVGESTVLNQ